MKILIVEDDKLLQQALQTKFEDQGADSTVSGNGQDAIEHLKNEKYDALVLDLLMPEVDGFEVLKQKKETQNADTLTFVVSNLEAEHNYKRAKDLGADHCLLKSEISLKELVEKVMKD
ncbi:MAG: response regulator transcription factor [Candidatus Peribacteraceae bacterium]|nr:response regulator transcription factor [Candidatus Peribacteraceae bacterium]